MSDPKNRIKPLVRMRYLVEAALVYTLFGFFWIFPVDIASHIGGFIGRTVGPRLGANKKALRNITRALPELSAAEHRNIAVGMWENLGRIMGEYPHLNSIEGKRVIIRGLEPVQALAAAGKPYMVVGAHLGNWEVLPLTAAKNHLSLQLIYRHANNPYVDALLKRARAPIAMKMARKGVEGARSVYSALKKGGGVGMLIDQKHNRGLPIPLFGRDAMTGTAVADLALRYNVPIYAAQVKRTKGANFEMTVEKVLEMPSALEMPNEADQVRDILTRLNQRIEAWTREAPAQWLWLHRRWPD